VDRVGLQSVRVLRKRLLMPWMGAASARTISAQARPLPEKTRRSRRLAAPLGWVCTHPTALNPDLISALVPRGDSFHV
jgi:hypothetical protein